jgi:5'-nucleotidase
LTQSGNQERPLILITNDDGHEAPGIAALAEILEPLGRVISVAPDRERSGAGHALTLDRPLRVRTLSKDRYAVNGTPTDCIHLGLDNLTDGLKPDLVVSGINRGLNIGDDVTYSGTVAGALEGTLLNIPAVAVSSGRFDDDNIDYHQSAGFILELCTRVLKHRLPEGVFLNVNIPPCEPNGVRVTRQGTRTYRASMDRRLDPSGKPYFWIAGADTTPTDEVDGDHRAIADGFISVSPLFANLTHESSLEPLRSWIPVDYR